MHSPQQTHGVFLTRNKEGIIRHTQGQEEQVWCHINKGSYLGGSINRYFIKSLRVFVLQCMPNTYMSLMSLIVCLTGSQRAPLYINK